MSANRSEHIKRQNSFLRRLDKLRCRLNFEAGTSKIYISLLPAKKDRTLSDKSSPSLSLAVSHSVTLLPSFTSLIFWIPEGVDKGMNSGHLLPGKKISLEVGQKGEAINFIGTTLFPPSSSRTICFSFGRFSSGSLRDSVIEMLRGFSCLPLPYRLISKIKQINVRKKKLKNASTVNFKQFVNLFRNIINSGVLK